MTAHARNIKQIGGNRGTSRSTKQRPSNKQRRDTDTDTNLKMMMCHKKIFFII
jgi:hypothetical protein